LAFSCKQQSIYIYISQSKNQHQYITNHIYISLTTKFVRNRQYYYKPLVQSTQYSLFTIFVVQSTQYS
jgi:hypothetical protein